MNHSISLELEETSTPEVVLEPIARRNKLRNGSVVLILSNRDTNLSLVRGRDVLDKLEIKTGAYLIVNYETLDVRSTNNIQWKMLDVNPLCGLLAFIDLAKEERDLLNTNHSATANSNKTLATVVKHGSRSWRVIPIEKSIFDQPEKLSNFLIESALGNESSIDFSGALRRLEPYGLIHYLAKFGTHKASLNELCVAYGLSYSHFRRLCRKTLGDSIKTQLRQWRAVRAVFTLLDRNLTISDVAYEQGYASPSHITKEIKRVFGMTPTELLNIGRATCR